VIEDNENTFKEFAQTGKTILIAAIPMLRPHIVKSMLSICLWLQKHDSSDGTKNEILVNTLNMLILTKCLIRFLFSYEKVDDSSDNLMIYKNQKASQDRNAREGLTTSKTQNDSNVGVSIGNVGNLTKWQQQK
jgi:hypothetical protein